MHTTEDAPTLADVQREHPAWTCWQSTSGVLYARRQQAPAGRPDVWGQDPPGLRDAITSFLRTAARDAPAGTPGHDKDKSRPRAG